MAKVESKIALSNCFKLLAACFYEPDKEMFLHEGLCENLASLFNACGCEKASLAASAMHKELLDSDPEELKVEHAHLFVGPFELAAAPYGSVYLEDKGRLMGESTMAVQKMYNKAGLALEVKEAPDHIAFELEFLHYLCLHEANAETENKNDEVLKYSQMRREFTKKFMAPWISDFCGNIRKGTDNDFYIHLADCLESFISEITSLYETASLVKQSEGSHACQASA